jgi:hypothetical protein
LKIKHLLDVWQIVESQGFNAFRWFYYYMFFVKMHKTAKPLQRNCKENCKSIKALKDKHLMKF